jgi:hypothetical protein
MRQLSSAFVCNLLVIAVAGTPQAVGATAPANDLLINATAITSLPFSDTIDVSGATTDADDSAALSPCFPGNTFTINNSVWYSYTTATDINLGIDLSATNFGAGVVIAENQGGSFGSRQCSVNTGVTNGQIHTQIGAGVTVSILIFNAGPLSAVSNLAVSFYPVTVPANDTIGGATVIPSLPFGDEEDTFLATSDADDVQVNATCGQPSTDASVWYVFTAGPNDTSVLFDTSGSGPFSDFGIIIATGSPGALTTLVCGIGAAAAPTSPGTTYYVLVSKAFGGHGERLQLNVSPTPPPPAIDASFDARGEVDHLGVAYLSGTYVCTSASLASIGAHVTQNKRSGNLNGFTEPFNCDGLRHAFRTTAIENAGDVEGRFVPGKVEVQFSSRACNVLECTFSPSSSQVVKLFMESQLGAQGG